VSSPPSRPRRPSALTVLGAVLLVLGLSCLGYVGYQYVGTDVVAGRSFAATRQELRQQWQDVPAPGAAKTTKGSRPTPLPGEATALLRIPAFGSSYEIPVREGTDLDVLAEGVGHYPGTAAPGEVGNFAVAGHRVTHGEPFRRLEELDKGDEVVVETATAVYTYVLDEAPRNLTVTEAATWVLDPVPGEPDQKPTRALITLTTCQDLFHSPDRSVGFGHLESTTNK
jgi:sortase A